MGGKKAPARFEGSRKLATVDGLNAFVRQAEAGQTFVYCEAPDPMYGDTWSRVSELAQQGFVTPLSSKRAGGGFVYSVARTRKRITREQSPQEKALSDPATDTIFRELKRAANFAQPCPSDAELARKAGLSSRHAAQFRFRQLIAVGLIESTLAYEGGVPSRVVTITGTGKFTALPKKWAALQQAAAREIAASGSAR